MTDDALRALLTEFDDIAIALRAGGGFTATVSGVVVAHAATMAELWTCLESADALAAVVAELGADRVPRRAVPRGYVLKAASGRDLYAVWHGGADNIGAIGSRAEMARAGFNEAALARADLYGTSARSFEDVPGYPVPFRAGGWDSAGLVVNNQAGPVSGGWLPRASLLAFAEASAAGDHVRAGSLLEPWED